MKNQLAERIANLPKLPGVYLMKDAAGKVIYVGKAKHLRNRVRSYFSGGDGRQSVPYIVKRVSDIEVIVTGTEHAAFVLERDLITKYKPRYNIRLKDDKAYLHVRLDRQAKWPKLELVRNPQNDGAEYFGPYTFSYELRTMLDLVKKVVPLRTCRDAVFYNRQRPCLEYQIKRCAAPCCLEVDRGEYDRWLDQAEQILRGKTKEIEAELETLMEEASGELRFEDATTYRNRLQIVENFSKRQSFVAAVGENRDAFAFYREETLMVVSVLRVRNGRIYENHNFCLEQVEVPTEEVIEAAVLQYYKGGRDIPDEVLLPVEIESTEVLTNALKVMRGGSVSLHHPQRGVKARLLGLAHVNAKEHFLSQFNSDARYQEIAEAIARTCQLEQMPRRIECLDISNLQGSDIVGAIVSFYDGEPDKSRYRQYKISFQEKPDDFAAVEEVVRRKLLRAKKTTELLPDLLIIDGGKGQLERALQAARDLDVEVDIVGLAKIRDQSGSKRSAGSRGGGSVQGERIFLPGALRAIPLDLQAESTRFLQRVRDEVHRYVISYHRKLRSKRAHHSKLDDIKGIGPERRHRLLRAFGSLKKLQKATPEEIAKAGRMPRSLALKVLAALSSKL